RACRCRRSQHSRSSPRDDQIYIELDELADQLREAFDIPICRAIFQVEILTLLVSQRCKSASECLQICSVEWRYCFKHPNAPSLIVLLRAQGSRPRRSTGYQQNEFPPPHSITSSLCRASNILVLAGCVSVAAAQRLTRLGRYGGANANFVRVCGRDYAAFWSPMALTSWLSSSTGGGERRSS